jgi:GTP-binding protein YchF
MKIGLIGLPNSGKTTIFNALTGHAAEVTTYADAASRPNIAIVDVIDERITRLSEMYKPGKTGYATVQFVDFAGLAHDSAGKVSFPDASIGMMRNVDTLALVVKNFPNVLGDVPAPLDDIEQMETELLISDLIICERWLEKIELSHKRGQKTPASQMEESTMRRILDCLNDGRRITKIELGRDEKKMVSGFQFLTGKPLLVILNSSEDNFGKNQELLEEIGKKHKVVEFAGNFEMDLTCLSDEEKQLFMEDMGIEESARNRLTQYAYEISSSISFFTVGTDEVRAWNIREGQTAADAAGAIHSDLARGFIRAERFSYDDLIECGSEKGVHDKGRFRLEGKDYIVKDGDILAIRFSV